jgi:zinc protease
MTAFSDGGTSLFSLKDYISARVTTDVINECGLGDFNKVELDKYLSDKIVNVNPYINEISEGFDGRCSVKDFETMLQLIYLYFTKPRQDTAAFNSYITKEKSSLENRSTSPEAAFRDTILVITSQHSPFRKPMTDKLLDEARLKRVTYIFKDRFGDPSNFSFFFVGNIDLKTVQPIIEKYLGGLPTVNRVESYRDLNIRKPDGIVKRSVYKGSEPKSIVYLDFHGNFDYTPENRIDLDLICEILDTRLIESIREEKSGVYNIGAYPSAVKYPVPLYDIVIYFPCAPENIDRLTAGIMEEIDKLRKDGPSEIDLNKGKEKLLRQRETDERENSFWVRELKKLYYNKEDSKSFLKYKKYLNSLTAQKMKEVTAKYFNKDNYIQVSLKPGNMK